MKKALVLFTLLSISSTLFAAEGKVIADCKGSKQLSSIKGLVLKEASDGQLVATVSALKLGSEDISFTKTAELEKGTKYTASSEENEGYILISKKEGQKEQLAALIGNDGSISILKCKN